MADRLDIIIFGATGFTGKNCIPPVVKLAKSQGRNLTWGIAGRSESKLKDVLVEMGKKIDVDLSAIPIILADVKDEESLKRMTTRARIIVNTCGPYRFFGEPVIKACIETGTHHVDVSGEPQYLETMQLKYDKAAREKGIYIVGACGFDSIPTDMGIWYMQSKFDGTLNSVETYLENTEEGGSRPGPGLNYGTWESAVYGLAHMGELRGIRTKLYPERMRQFSPKLKSRGHVHKSEFTNAYTLVFPGSDRSVVMRSQRYFYEHEKMRPIQIQTYMCFSSLVSVILLAIMGGIFTILAKFSFGRKLLLQHPKFFSLGFASHDGPSDDKMEHTLFSVTLVAEGWPEKLADCNDEFATPPSKRMIAKVSGRNPGYGMTTMALVLSAITILQENKKMPTTGGVFPAGAAFAHTSLLEKLNENGLKFETISIEDIKP